MIGPRRPPRFYYGWIVLLLSTLCIFLAAGSRSLYALFYVAQVEEFGWSRGGGSIPYAVNLFVLVTGTPLVGILLDRLGPRIVFTVAFVFTALGFWLGMFIHQTWHLALTFGLLAGVGFVANSMPFHGSVLAKWFSARRGLAIGFASAGMGIAQAVMSPLFQTVITRWGWRTGYLLLGCLIAVMTIPLVFFFRADPASMGQRPDGASSGRVFTARRRSSRVRTMDIRDPQWVATDWTLPRALRTRAFWGLLGISLFQSFALHFTGVHTVALLVDSGFSRAAAAALYGVMGGGLTVGLFFWGQLSDRIGRELAYTLGSVCFGAGLALIGVLDPAAGATPAWIAAIVLGLGLGSRPTLFSLIAVDIFQGRQAGRIIGLASAGLGIGGTVGSVSAGLIYDHTGSYTGAIFLCEATLVLSALSAWIAAPSRVRRAVLKPREAEKEIFLHRGRR